MTANKRMNVAKNVPVEVGVSAKTLFINVTNDWKWNNISSECTVYTV